MNQNKLPKKISWEGIIFLLSAIVTIISIWTNKSLFLIILSLSILTIISFFYNLANNRSPLNWIISFFLFLYTLLFFSASFGNFSLMDHSFISGSILLSLTLFFIHQLYISISKKESDFSEFLSFFLIYLSIFILIVTFFSLIYQNNSDIVYKSESIGSNYSPFDYFYFSFQKFYLQNFGDFFPLKFSRIIVLIEILISIFFHLFIFKNYFLNTGKINLAKEFFGHVKDSNIRAK